MGLSQTSYFPPISNSAIDVNHLQILYSGSQYRFLQPIDEPKILKVWCDLFLEAAELPTVQDS